MSHRGDVQGPAGLHVNLLGPLVVSVDGSVVQPKGSQVPRLVSLLALRNGTPVRIETVIDVIWPDSPPSQARRVALNLVGRMRQLLGSGSATTRDGAVSLVDAVTDLDEFEALREDADRHQRRSDTSRERASLNAALRLVRGVPLDELADDPFFGAESARLHRAIDRVRLRASRLALDEDDHDAAREGAEAVLARDPLSQQALGVLMSALAGAGRVRESLAAYQDARRRLAEESGLDPDPMLTELYREILQSDASGVSKPRTVPRQLPRLSDHVSVHGDEHTRARRALSVLDTTSPPIVAVNGPGGIGKSAFALELAHGMKHRYPDGQLYADFHGNTPGHEPLDAGQVVRRFLRSLGHSPEQWPDAEAAAGHFRSVTADLRILIVLDDVRDAAQIRPLLPNGSGCGVIVTSRRALPSLRGTAHLELPYLDFDDSRVLFRTGVDHPFAPEDERALDGVLDRCGGLPLALCVAAARFNAAEPGSLTGILESLSDKALGLAGFDDGEHSLAASLAGSLKALNATPAGAEAAELFAMMALHPGPAISVEVAGAMVDKPIPTVRHLCELLRRYRLVEQHRPDRLSMHDLVRLFATAEAGKLDRAAAEAAVRRVHSAYIDAAAQAYRFFREHVHTPAGRSRLDFVPDDLPASPVEFASLEEADEWLIEHFPVFTELVRAVGAGDRWFPGLLFMLMSPSVATRAGMIAERTAIATSAAALPETADQPWAVYIYNDLAELQLAVGESAAALGNLDIGEQLARKHNRFIEAVGVKVARIRALRLLGEVDRALALAEEVIAEARQRDLGDIASRAGIYRSYLLDVRGEHDAAIDQSTELVAYAEDEAAGIKPIRLAVFLNNHAVRLIHGGRVTEGLSVLERAKAIAIEQGFEESYIYAAILWGQAEAHKELGHDSTADELWKTAAELLLANGRISPAEYDEILAGRRPVIDPARLPASPNEVGRLRKRPGH